MQDACCFNITTRLGIASSLVWSMEEADRTPDWKHLNLQLKAACMGSLIHIRVDSVGWLSLVVYQPTIKPSFLNNIT